MAIKFNLNNTTLPVLVNVKKDLFSKEKDNVIFDSWFFIFSLKSKQGNQFDCLVHYMAIDIKSPEAPAFYMLATSIFDRAKFRHSYKEFIYDKNSFQVSDVNIQASMPDLKITGSFNKFQLTSALSDTDSINMTVEPSGNVLYNNASGKFPMLHGITGHIAIPSIKASGTLTTKEGTFEVEGDAWLDRQWLENIENGLQSMMSGGKQYSWVWFSLKMDNGDFISIWDIMDANHKTSCAWATILQPDGSHIVAPIKPLMQDASDIWKSEATGQHYPTKFKITIPAVNAVLDVESIYREQEIVSAWDSKYEGSGIVTGTYKGKPTKSTSYFEVVGNWQTLD